MAARRPAHLTDLLHKWPRFLQQLVRCFWLVHESCRYHCAAAQLESAAESVVNIIHNYSQHLAQTALGATSTASDTAPDAGVPGGRGNGCGPDVPAADDTVVDRSTALRECLELLVQGVQVCVCVCVCVCVRACVCVCVMCVVFDV